MTYRKRILVIRLSAFGDVAILEPVLRLRAEANPDVLFFLAAPPRLAALFADIPNVQFIPTIKKQSSRNLFRQLSKLQPDMVADMHHVNRVIRACWLFRLHGIPVRSIRKHTPSPIPSWMRYNIVFDRCGVAASPNLELLSKKYWTPQKKEEKIFNIGIAPFAQHQGKIWPLEQMEQLIGMLDKSKRYNISLFGSPDESKTLESWASRFSHAHSLAGRLTFEEELQIIAKLDLMVSMDSANMHFASCLGVPVVSIWGATHPCRGFYGWRQNPDWAVQNDSSTCRPCSKYGNNPCSKGNYPCLTSISPKQVFDKIEEVLR